MKRKIDSVEAWTYYVNLLCQTVIDAAASGILVDAQAVWRPRPYAEFLAEHEQVMQNHWYLMEDMYVRKALLNFWRERMTERCCKNRRSFNTKISKVLLSDAPRDTRN